MKPFKAPVEDILFSLERVAGAARIPGWDGDLAAEILSHFADFAENEIAPLDEIGDRQGCRLIDGRVRMPDGFKEVYHAYVEQGWPGLTAPEAFGGQGVDAAIHAGVSEIFTGACHSLQMVTGLVPGRDPDSFRVRHGGSTRTLHSAACRRQVAEYHVPLRAERRLRSLAHPHARRAGRRSLAYLRAKRSSSPAAIRT